MRRFLAVSALAATLLLCPAPRASAQQAPPAIPVPSGPPADGGADTPPPFMVRPKHAAQPPKADLTYASRPAPENFRGLAWGTGLEQARAALGLVPVTSPKTLRDTYQRPDELLKLGMADIRTVAYYFPKGKFSGVGIMFEGETNFFLVKDHLIELYGPGRQVGDRYGWTWTHVNIDLRLKEGAGELRYTYEP